MGASKRSGSLPWGPAAEKEGQSHPLLGLAAQPATETAFPTPLALLPHTEGGPLWAPTLSKASPTFRQGRNGTPLSGIARESARSRPPGRSLPSGAQATQLTPLSQPCPGAPSPTDRGGGPGSSGTHSHRHGRGLLLGAVQSLQPGQQVLHEPIFHHFLRRERLPQLRGISAGGRRAGAP